MSERDVSVGEGAEIANRAITDTILEKALPIVGSIIIGLRDGRDRLILEKRLQLVEDQMKGVLDARGLPPSTVSQIPVETKLKLRRFVFDSLEEGDEYLRLLIEYFRLALESPSHPDQARMEVIASTLDSLATSDLKTLITIGKVTKQLQGPITVSSGNHKLIFPQAQSGINYLTAGNCGDPYIFHSIYRLYLHGCVSVQPPQPQAASQWQTSLTLNSVQSVGTSLE